MTDATNDSVALRPGDLPADAVLTMTYRNWRGETAQRRIRVLSIRFGTTEWHPDPGVLLRAIDLDKGQEREFALADCDFLSMTTGA